MPGDWGDDAHLLRDLWPCEPLPADRLPAVVEARTRGWFLAPDAPLWCFLPAVWPPGERTWLPDRSVRVVRFQRDGLPGTVIPFSAWDHVEQEDAVNDMLRSAGVPTRPFGRLWLLRPPPGFDDLDGAVDALAAGAEAAGVPVVCAAGLVGWTRATVRTWFGDA